MVGALWISLGVVSFLLLLSEILGRLSCVRENTVHQLIFRVVIVVLLKLMRLILFGLGLGGL